MKYVLGRPQLCTMYVLKDLTLTNKQKTKQKEKIGRSQRFEYTFSWTKEFKLPIQEEIVE